MKLSSSASGAQQDSGPGHGSEWWRCREWGAGEGAGGAKSDLEPRDQETRQSAILSPSPLHQQRPRHSRRPPPAALIQPARHQDTPLANYHQLHKRGRGQATQ